jgi:hypothetical protein
VPKDNNRPSFQPAMCVREESGILDEEGVPKIITLEMRK